jgi:hypothetical protein
MSDHGLDEHQVNGGGDGDRMVTSRELKHRWHKSDMWLWRESQHPDSPLHPPFYVNGRRHWWMSWVLAAERKFAGED